MQENPQLLNGYTIRLATAADAAELGKIRYRTMTRPGSLSLAELQLDLPEVIAAYFQEALLSNQTRLWVAVHEATNQIVSTLGYMVFQRPIGNDGVIGKCGYVSGFWTSSGHRRKGLASNLLKIAIEDAKAMGLTQLEIKFKAGEENLVNQFGPSSAHALPTDLKSKPNSRIINLT